MTAQSVQYDGIMHDFTTTSTASAAGRAPTGRPGSRAGGTSPRRDRSARAAREDSQEDGRKRAQDKQRQNCRPLPLPRRADLRPFPRKYQRLRKNKDSRHSPLLRRPLPPPGRAIVERPSPGRKMLASFPCALSPPETSHIPPDLHLAPFKRIPAMENLCDPDDVRPQVPLHRLLDAENNRPLELLSNSRYQLCKTFEPYLNIGIGCLKFQY